MTCARALPVASQRVAATLGVPSAAIALDASVLDGTGRTAFALGDVGVLLLPGDLDADLERRVREHVAPMLATTLAVALQHEALMAESVENASLRRSDVIKTTLLRAISHDLRTPLTSIVAAGDSLRLAGLAADERDELGGLVVSEGRRLGRLIDELLDLSRLEAGAAAPQRARCSLEEILRTALDGRPDAGQVRLGIDSELPPLDVDGAQLERAFANLIDNGVRHSQGRPVLVRARVVGRALVVRVVDQGPGIPAVGVRADLRAVLPRRQRPADDGHGTRPCDRKGLRRGQRWIDLGRVRPGPGNVVRREPADRRAGRDRPVMAARQPLVVSVDLEDRTA